MWQTVRNVVVMLFCLLIVYLYLNIFLRVCQDLTPTYGTLRLQNSPLRRQNS